MFPFNVCLQSLLRRRSLGSSRNIPLARGGGILRDERKERLRRRLVFAGLITFPTCSFRNVEDGVASEEEGRKNGLAVPSTK